LGSVIPVLVTPYNIDTMTLAETCRVGRLRFVMYHYVREPNSDLPHFKFLHINDFKKQLDAFQAEHFFPTRAQVAAFISGDQEALPRDRKSIVLTFDDGLADHFQYVFPELQNRGLWGIFYIAAGPYFEKDLLDVHKVHALLGRYAPNLVLDFAKEILGSSPEYFHSKRLSEFRENTYTAEMQNNDDATTSFKQLVNYFLKPSHKKKVLSMLMENFFPSASHNLARAWYMNEEQLGIMCSGGMVLGAHSVSHSVLSTLTAEEQTQEIQRSLKYVADIAAKNPSYDGFPHFRTFCFPYGGSHTYNRHTLDTLQNEACQFSLDVDPQDCDEDMLKTRRQCLPRWDCNKFAFGTCFKNEVSPQHQSGLGILNDGARELCD
jgi:peptidoglycan/xylan/chitin deacetylase (PgdA/CDA1 family)